MRLGFDLLVLLAALYLIALVLASVFFPEIAKAQPLYLVCPAIIMNALSVVLYFYEKHGEKINRLG